MKKRNQPNTAATTNNQPDTYYTSDITVNVIRRNQNFKYLFDSIAIDHSKLEVLLDPKGDDNCGFRAVSLAVYGNQESWITVKEKMLETYLKNYKTLYSIYQPDHDECMYMLTCTEAPNWNVRAWFLSCFCRQIVADTYKTAVYMYSRSVAIIETTSPPTENIMKNQSLFVPLQEVDPSKEPIMLYLANSHYYLLKPFWTPTGKHKKTTPPHLNHYHNAIRRNYPKLCPTDYALFYQ
ncbi:hypothetical protein BDF21DRAFT_464685 [Thamnidium elegans]|uniref:OTU domain-containing protein n=1 Tax=Thamnidium elegans TaxID=101142 RepID=A0A8H7VTN5_9FUNG|nr:hypothetical protein INT48_008311 [Thamnidium elegans]KAI8076294.1 hypothetical protein BDF21DRAFT_464685 [Thamnidium elegans]